MKYCIPTILTVPGTETKVTPESEVPIIPKATSTHEALLFALKNDALSAFFEVTTATAKRAMKYTIRTQAITRGDMRVFLCN
jgi:hypothetical protein